MSDDLVPGNATPEKVDKLIETGKLDSRKLGRGYLELRGKLQTIVEEIAKFYHPEAKDSVFTLIKMDLENVVWKLQEATHEILYTIEQIEETVTEFGKEKEQREDLSEEDIKENLSRMTTSLFESCNFQDLTGQRINIVINTLDVISTHLGKMVEILGKKSFKGIDVPEIKEVTEDTENLSGPDLLGTSGMKQSDIDDLFK